MVGLLAVATCLALLLTNCGGTIPAPVATVPADGWASTTSAAAEAVFVALQKQVEGAAVVKKVLPESVQVSSSQQVKLALEVDGRAQEFILHSEADKMLQPVPLAGATAPQALVLPADGQQAVNTLRRGAALEDFTLAGPLELVFKEATDVALHLPHQADAGTVRRVVVAGGAAVTVRGARSVAMRWPLDLPALSASYLAQTWGSKVGGIAPTPQRPLAGVMQLSAGLRSKALQQQAAKNGKAALLAVEVEAGASTALTTAAPHPGAPVPRLKVHRIGQHSILLLPRSPQGAAGEGALQLSWAWPLPDASTSSLQQYENLLQQILAEQPLDAARVAEEGVTLRLVKSQAEALTLMQLDVELERQQNTTALSGTGTLLDGMEVGDSAVEVWRGVVSIAPDGKGGLRFQALHAQLVDRAHSTISFSPTAEAMLRGNLTLPHDFDVMYPNQGY